MKKIANMTFHSAYNYGSNLQAYALQEYVKKICNNDCEYKIINLRTETQKQKYAVIRKWNSAKNIFRNLLSIGKIKELKEKNRRFEDFINNYLDITKEYATAEELKNEKFDFDYYISGSDQLWNLNAADFEWGYLLDFTDSKNKISYAASMGPKAIDIPAEKKARFESNIKEYKAISVRESGTLKTINNICDINAQINVDPTMLLDKSEWEKLLPKERIVKEKYILFYSLYPDKKMIKLVKNISKQLNLPVVTTKLCNQYDAFSGFKKVYETGPIEFLSLIRDAELVLSASFHGTVFSILLNKPFYSINGLKDNRINGLLQTTELTDRSIDQDNYIEKCKNAFSVNFDSAEKTINIERNKSKKFLEEALDI